jgi:hypothetical protein
VADHINCSGQRDQQTARRGLTIVEGASTSRYTAPTVRAMTAAFTAKYHSRAPVIR